MPALSIEQVEALVQRDLTTRAKVEGGAMPEQELRELIMKYAPLCDATKDEVERTFRKMRARRGVVMEIGDILTDDEGFVRWFDTSRRRTTEWFYWERYRAEISDSGFPGPVIAAMHAKTDAVIGLCGDPLSEAPFDRRGMVMGDVQAGKTGNYTALVSKAADVGYRVAFCIRLEMAEIVFAARLMLAIRHRNVRGDLALKSQARNGPVPYDPPLRSGRAGNFVVWQCAPASLWRRRSPSTNGRAWLPIPR